LQRAHQRLLVMILADNDSVFPQAAGQTYKSSLVLSFKKERSFLKKRTKKLL
jgi:hypothetical protein